MATVTFENVTRTYPGADTPAVTDFNLEVHDGEFMVLVGPSGSGKSTALRMLAGLEDLTGGRIFIDDRDVTGLPPKDRDIAMVFQNYALYPHLTVAENLGFPLQAAKLGKAERDHRVVEAATLLDLEELLDRKPQALSGGQRQRVAMGRALVRNPKVFCMDEPLSNLDATLRVATRARIEALQKRLGVTTVYVTHDQSEAMTMGDRIAVMRDGALQQVDSPLQLFDRPSNMFVAGFIGSPAMNFFIDRVALGHVRLGTMTLALATQFTGLTGTEVAIGVRPAAWKIVSAGQQAISAVITFVEELGDETFLHATSNVEGAPEGIVIHTAGQRSHSVGSVMHLTCDPGDVHLFSVETGQRMAPGSGRGVDVPLLG